MQHFLLISPFWRSNKHQNIIIIITQRNLKINFLQSLLSDAMKFNAKLLIPSIHYVKLLDVGRALNPRIRLN